MYSITGVLSGSVLSRTLRPDGSYSARSRSGQSESHPRRRHTEAATVADVEHAFVVMLLTGSAAEGCAQHAVARRGSGHRLVVDPRTRRRTTTRTGVAHLDSPRHPRPPNTCEERRGPIVFSTHRHTCVATGAKKAAAVLWKRSCRFTSVPTTCDGRQHSTWATWAFIGFTLRTC
jgi:hypothetical protein